MKYNNRHITTHPIVPKLQKYLNDYFMMVLYGGRDSGKTVAMIHLLLTMVMTGSHKIAIFRAEKKQLEKDSIMAMMRDTMAEWGLEHCCKTIGDRFLINSRIEIEVNGFKSVISFDFVGNNPEKLRGTYDRYDIFVFEEFHQFRRDVLDVALPTLERAPNKPHLLGTCNLEHQDTYIYEMLKLGGLEREEEGWQSATDELATEHAYEPPYPHFGIGIEMLYETNPYLTPFARHRITAMKKSNYEEYLVIYRNHPRLLKDEIVLRNWRIEPFDLTFDQAGNAWFENQQVTLRYGMDFGSNHFFVNVEAFMIQRNEYDEKQNCIMPVRYIYINRVVMEQGLSTMMIIPRILDRMPEQIYFQKQCIADCQRKDTINDLKNGMPVRGVPSYPSMRLKPAYKWGKMNNGNRDSKGAILDGTAFLQRSVIIINPECQIDPHTGRKHCDNVVEQFKKWRWYVDIDTKTGIKTIQDKLVDADDDLPDALRYGFELDIQGQQTSSGEFNTSFWDNQQAIGAML